MARLLLLWVTQDKAAARGAQGGKAPKCGRRMNPGAEEKVGRGSRETRERKEKREANRLTSPPQCGIRVIKEARIVLLRLNLALLLRTTCNCWTPKTRESVARPRERAALWPGRPPSLSAVAAGSNRLAVRSMRAHLPLPRRATVAACRPRVGEWPRRRLAEARTCACASAPSTSPVRTTPRVELTPRRVGDAREGRLLVQDGGAAGVGAPASWPPAR